MIVRDALALSRTHNFSLVRSVPDLRLGLYGAVYEVDVLLTMKGLGPGSAYVALGLG